MEISLHDLGWRDVFAQAFAALSESTGLVPGRVVLQQRGRYSVATEAGEVSAELEARFRKQAGAASELPCVGDWVAIRLPADADGLGNIRALLPRQTKLSRKAAGPEPVEQVLAANLDTIFIAMGLDGDFNLRRLERYLTVAWASGALPVVLLTKADLCSGEEQAGRIAEAQAIAPQVTVLATSVPPDRDAASAEDARARVNPFLAPGQTVVLLGSSGVGKSTLVNTLMWHGVLRTGEVRPSDSRGRHTTTQRQLFRVPGGALVIDTPGLRELQPWSAKAGVDVTFADVVSFADACRFRDCRHHREPGCAVTVAVARGDLSAERVASFTKLQAEQKGATGGGGLAPRPGRGRGEPYGPNPARRKPKPDFRPG